MRAFFPAFPPSESSATNEPGPASTRRFRTRLPAFLLAALTGCAAIEPARMELPPGLETETEAIVLTGLGGGTSGSFRLADYSGTFTRGESRLGILDPLLVLNRASSSFVVAGPGLATPTSARCKMRQDSVTVGVISVDTRKMHYGCDFTSDGRAIAAYFAIARADDTFGARVTGTERRGEMMLGATRLGLRSTSRLAGSSWQTETPIGYLMDLDGRTVAGIELNGTRPTLFLPRHGDPEVRQAALFASLALAVLWDPAGSMLGD